MTAAVRARLATGVKYIYSTTFAFAAALRDGSVVVWGDAFCGGNPGAVRDQLATGVQDIYVNDRALVAVKADGSVLAWGDPEWGGDL